MIKHIKGQSLVIDSFEILFYELPDGECPVMDFIEAQPRKMYTKIYKTMSLLEEFGPDLRMPYSESLDDGIFQLRVIQGNNITRILYFFVKGNQIVFTNGFVKKTSKTPHKEISLAKRYRNDYLNRLKEE